MPGQGERCWRWNGGFSLLPPAPSSFGEEGEKGLPRPGKRGRWGLSRSENRFAQGALRALGIPGSCRPYGAKEIILVG